MTKNLTLAIDDDLLDKARVIAAMERTTVNALVRQFLEDLVNSRDRRAAARQRLVEKSRASQARVGDVTWTRDDLHER